MSSFVVALVTEGVSATGLTVIVAVTDRRPGRSRAAESKPAPRMSAVPKKSAPGVNFEPGVALGEGDEVAAIDRRSAVVLEQGAVRDVGDLEVRHFGAVHGVATDHQSGSRLSVFVGRWRW